MPCGYIWREGESPVSDVDGDDVRHRDGTPSKSNSKGAVISGPSIASKTTPTSPPEPPSLDSEVRLFPATG